ncbi:MAG: type I DNA topoisomerase [Candidatus Omnitrophica bacterium]|nr:type I DNA topoisomerase [Candidatus Omnitrophota bacterium]
MTNSLVIVESPAKAKTISRFLGRDFRFSASLGHIRDLPAHKFGVDIKRDFEPTYEVPPDKKKIVRQLLLAAKNSGDIYLATDEDREGEAIAWHIAILLERPLEEIKRVVFHEITESAIKEAFRHPREINLSLVRAQQARRILDRVVGYQLSPFLSEKMRRRGLSAGRVQSVALRMIAEREKEIEKFHPQEYWSIKANLRPHLSPPLRGRPHPNPSPTSGEGKREGGEGKSSFSAILSSIEGKKIPQLGIKTKEEAENITSDLEGSSFIVERLKKEEKRRYPFPPFTTSTLQQEASYRLRFSAKKTMRVAQQLYEGIQLEKGQVGLITYMRTDSLSISNLAQREALSYVKNELGKDYVPERPNFYKTKAKGAQEAHEAIRPTSVLRTPEAINKFLNPDQNKIYILIWNRFVASQMTPAIFDTVLAEIKANKYLFCAKGETLKFPGYKRVYSEVKKEQETILPDLQENEPLTCIKLIPEQHFTKPPSRYTEATLIKTMEKYGIGRPSTYAPTISTILDRKYVELEKRHFKPLPLGVTVNEILIKYFSELIKVDFTARMEENLDEIAAGQQEWVKVLNDFYRPFSEKLRVAAGEPSPPQNFGGREKRRPPAQETGEKCPECGSPLLLREGKYGKFFGCSTFPKCKYTRPLKTQKQASAQQTTEKCPKCGSPLLLREGKYGKFFGCSKFPKCRYIKKC